MFEESLVSEGLDTDEIDKNVDKNAADLNPTRNNRFVRMDVSSCRVIIVYRLLYIVCCIGSISSILLCIQ